MPDPRPIIGRVVAVQGTTPGPAGGISYTIDVQDSGGDGVFRLEDQVPQFRWPDAIDTVALAVGSLVNGCMAQNRVVWWFIERFEFAECPQVGEQAMQMRFDENGNIVRVTVPPFEGGGSGSSSANPGGSAPIGGGGSVD